MSTQSQSVLILTPSHFEPNTKTRLGFNLLTRHLKDFNQYDFVVCKNKNGSYELVKGTEKQFKQFTKTV
jgi:hypothetical protein